MHPRNRTHPALVHAPAQAAPRPSRPGQPPPPLPRAAPTCQGLDTPALQLPAAPHQLRPDGLHKDHGRLLTVPGPLLHLAGRAL